ncbi:MAG: nucleoside-diphosphate kinase [Parachlamydiaceae bacterium]
MLKLILTCLPLLLFAEQTLSIIKPDAVKANHIGAIIDRFERNGLKIAAIKKVSLSEEDAKRFYAVHKDRPFYNDLAKFMSSGPVVVMVLEGDDAVLKNRKIMGATNPEKADPGTIRKDFAKSMQENAVHCSDSLESAASEIKFFFSPSEIISN